MSDDGAGYQGTDEREALDKGVIHVPGGMERHGMTPRHALQKGTQFTTSELFISGIFHLTWVSESLEGETTGKRGRLYLRDNRYRMIVSPPNPHREVIRS